MDNFEQGLTDVAAKLRAAKSEVLNAGTAAFVLRARDHIKELEQQFAGGHPAGSPEEEAAHLGTELATASDRIAELEQQKDTAYNERNRVIAALAKLALVHGHQVGLAGHPLEDTEWEDDWRTIVFIDMPQPIGQVSWHIHDSERYLFASLPPYKGQWDGHTTEEKYARMEEDL